MAKMCSSDKREEEAMWLKSGGCCSRDVDICLEGGKETENFVGIPLSIIVAST